jgi:drug/metabolite transporter (DMT)-like permease
MHLSGGLSSSLFGVLYIICTGKKQLLLYKNINPNLILFGILQSICGFSLFNAFSDKDLISSTAILFVNSSSILVTFLAPILIKEKTSIIEFICAIVGFVGLIVFALGKDGGFGSFVPSYGLWLSIIALIFNSLASLVNRRVSQEFPSELVSLCVSVGNIFVSLLGFVIFPFDLLELSSLDYVLGFGTGIFTGFLAFLLLSRAYAKLKVQTVLIILMTQPVLSGILGYLFLGEVFNLRMGFGLVIVLASTLGLIMSKK